MYQERYSPWHRFAPEDRQFRQRIRAERWRILRYNLCKTILAIVVFIIIYNCLPDWMDNLRSDDFYERRRLRLEQAELEKEQEQQLSISDT